MIEKIIEAGFSRASLTIKNKAHEKKAASYLKGMN
jgi:hypothetical protein